jgi:hypothetical protein
MSKSQKYKLEHIPTNMRLGELIVEGRLMLRPHECATIGKLRQFGDNIKRISESNIPGQKRPDVHWRHTQWEIKTISGNTRSNIVHALQTAKTQSPHIIVDIARTKRQTNAILRDIYYYFSGSKSIKCIFVMIKNEYCVFT